MGAECVKMSPKQSRNMHAERMDTVQNELRRCEQNLHFTLIIEHIKLTNMTNRVKQIKFKLKDEFEISYGIQDFTVQEKLVKSEKTQKIQFEFPANKLDSKKMTVEIIDNDNKVMEALKIKLLHLCTGPVHHDHLLKQLKARMMFDLHIYQNIETQTTCQDFNIQLLENNDWRKQYFFYKLSLIVKNILLKTEMQENNLESEGGYMDEDGIYDIQKITGSVPNNILKDSDFKIQILAQTFSEQSNVENQDVVSTVFIPYRKIENCQRSTSLTKNGIDYTNKKLNFCESFKYQGKVIGKFSFNINLESSILYAQQMEGLIYSQIGVNSVSPTILQSNEGLIKELRDIYKSVKGMKSSTLPQKEQMMKGIDEMYLKFKKSNDQIFTSEDQLFERQITLIKLLNQLSGLISQGQDLLNQRLWRIIDYIAHKPQLTVRYLSIHDQKSSQNQLFLKYYKFICEVLCKIIASTQTGITFHELQCIQKFIAFAYFRFPWIQEIILKAIYKKQDSDISEEKLIELGASRSCKSPSKSYVYDWELNVFNKIRQNQEFKNMLSSLQAISKSHQDWDCLLFNRNDDDLFYGLYVEIWTEAQHTLKNLRGKILWEYFPNYGELLSCFLGEMNNSKVTDFSSKFKVCSNKLALNEKLLNTFVNLLFPKTYLYEISCVMKCLNLLESYFEVLRLAGKKLPHDFHFNFFYTGIKTIFNQNHSYLIVKTILILYKYYDIFTYDFKKTLNSYILSSQIFYLLFLHWCSNVRKMFHHILYFKVLPSQANNPQEGFAKIKSQSQKSFLEEDLPLDKKLNAFIRQIESQSKQIKTTKQIEVRVCQKQYHQKMKANLKTIILQRKLRNQQRLNQQKEEDIPIMRKQSLFVGTRELQYSSFRKMSVTDDVGCRSIDASYLKYTLVSLKEYTEVKKEENPNKEIQKLSNLFQGDIDS